MKDTRAPATPTSRFRAVFVRYCIKIKLSCHDMELRCQYRKRIVGLSLPSYTVIVMFAPPMQRQSVSRSIGYREQDVLGGGYMQLFSPQMAFINPREMAAMNLILFDEPMKRSPWFGERINAEFVEKSSDSGEPQTLWFTDDHIPMSTHQVGNVRRNPIRTLALSWAAVHY